MGVAGYMEAHGFVVYFRGRDMRGVWNSVRERWRGLARGKRGGASLLEASAGLAVGALVIAGLAWGVAEYNENRRIAEAARQMRDMMRAAEAYVQAHRYVLASQISVSATSPHLVPSGVSSEGELPTTTIESGPLAGLPTLAGAGLVRPGGASAINRYGHEQRVVVRHPAPGRLEVMVLQVGGAEMPARSLRRLANRVGGHAGFVERPSGGGEPTTIRGTDGWNADVTTWIVDSATRPTVGRAAALVTVPYDTRILEGVHRPVIGSAQAARMTTWVDMNNHDLRQGDEMDSQLLDTDRMRVNEARTVGTPCDQEREIARQTIDGSLLLCWDGVWRPQRITVVN